MQRWEYRREAVKLSVEPQADGYQETRAALIERVATTWVALLNELGSDGWELIHETTGVVSGEPVTVVCSGTLKRAVA